ncbi:MAG: YdcF family protein [Beijerinckiaceae bacterium]|nr:YdcF family protein [Beijerinckiaceae bacterium]
MFFVLSKVLWALVAPFNLLALLVVAGACLLFTRFAKTGRRMVALAAVGFLVLGASPLGVVMLRVLEDRFPRPPADMPAPAGIVVLGGGVNELVTRLRGPVELSGAGDRMTEAAMLARRYPQAKLVFTGGSAALLGSPYKEAHVARQLFLGLGLPAEQLVFESESRNTYENAVFTRDLVKPKPGDRWLLVTSASHMPRSVGIFREAGFEVTPYPVDYVTTGLRGELFRVSMDLGEGLSNVDRALREYIGLVAYRLTGRSDALFPGP